MFSEIVVFIFTFKQTSAALSWKWRHCDPSKFWELCIRTFWIFSATA